MAKMKLNKFTFKTGKSRGYS